MYLISEKGLCKVLKASRGRGYEIIPDGRNITINGIHWAIQSETPELPVKAALQIVEDAGYLPVEAMRVQAGTPNQLIIPEAAMTRTAFFKLDTAEVRGMKKIPVIFKEHWQLYQTDTGKVYAFDTALLEMVDFGATEPGTVMRDNGTAGIWYYDAQAVYIAPGHFSAEDTEKLVHIAALDWERQQSHDDPVENMSLFDEHPATSEDDQEEAATAHDAPSNEEDKEPGGADEEPGEAAGDGTQA